ncbi:MAG: DUF898 family protein [Deltaproteobacteria bacterium]|nr:DUF898 family protein [Deltaproteobacteria bacterium]
MELPDMLCIIHCFWAKARVRSRTWGQRAVDGDRFSCNGTGQETFPGWITAVVVFGWPFVFLQNVPMFTDKRKVQWVLRTFMGTIQGKT